MVGQRADHVAAISPTTNLIWDEAFGDLFINQSSPFEKASRPESIIFSSTLANMKLFCMIVGKGTIVFVDVDSTDLIGEVKDRFKERSGYKYPSCYLDLFLAKRGHHGDWLTPLDQDYDDLASDYELVAAKYLTEEMQLDPTWAVKDYADFADAPAAGAVHVVKFPTKVTNKKPKTAQTTESDGKLRISSRCENEK